MTAHLKQPLPLEPAPKAHRPFGERRPIPPVRFSRDELFLRAGYVIGRRATFRALSDELAKRDRDLAQLRAEFGRETGDLRSLLNQASHKLSYLQKLDLAMHARPLPGLH
jgi:hypothetical protein